jgi:AraC-like DNA-binding protein
MTPSMIDDRTPVYLDTVALAVKLLGRERIRASAVLDGSGVSVEQVRRGEITITYAQELIVLENARRLSRDPALGIKLGLGVHTSVTGLRGYTMQCAPSFETAWRFACDHPLTGGSYFKLKVVKGRTHASIVVVGYRFGERMRQLNTEICMAAIRSESEDLLGYPPPVRSVAFAFPRASLRASFLRDVFGCEVTFDAPDTRISFPLALLRKRLPTSDDVTFRHLVPKCHELELKFATLAQQPLTIQVKQLLYQSLPRFRYIDAVADTLGLGVRTLQRQLSLQGTTFQVLVDQVSADLAIQLLKSPDRMIHEVAAQLGYFDAATFSRAFRKWTGRNPGDYREAFGLTDRIKVAVG